LKDIHVLITGHTGFKGAWLAALLDAKGAKVSGVSLDPLPGGIFEKARIAELLENDIRQDIREFSSLSKVFQKLQPDVVIHLAAQPLVLASYTNPEETYQTNVMGTLNVLRAVEATNSVKATLVITTDKVYQHRSGESAPFLETDALGAADPYSTSKAMADLLTQSWMLSHPKQKLAIARAGNVIGGGDVAPNRLFPDLFRAFQANQVASLRNPDSVRPWQHVLDCLSGYLKICEALLSGSLSQDSFNFGPDPSSPLSVRDVAKVATDRWGDSAKCRDVSGEQPLEANLLTLDSSKAKRKLGWVEKLSPNDAVSWTVEWEKVASTGVQHRNITLEQIENFSRL
jgi:CDP-glucose 4,6-dehydratase